MSATNTSSVMTTIEDDSAPLLPHELSAFTAPPPLPTTPLPHRPKQLPPKITSTYRQTPPSQAIVSPAVPVILHHNHRQPLSPLEPFPAFDPRVGPPEESLYHHSWAVHRDTSNDAPTARTPKSEPQQRQCREDGEQENHHVSSKSNRQPNAVTTSTISITTSLLPSSGEEIDGPFLKLIIRSHTLFALAERLLPSTSAVANKKALAYLNEARKVLAGLEKQSRRKLGGCDCTAQQREQQQLIEFSAEKLREKLNALEERGLAEKERRDEDDQNEKTARVTAWLEEL